MLASSTSCSTLFVSFMHSISFLFFHQIHWGNCYGPQPDAEYAPTDPYFEHSQFNPTLNAQGKPKGPTAVTISPCPTPATAHAFDGVTNPRVASWNKSESGTISTYMQQYTSDEHSGCCDEWQSARDDIGFRNRSSRQVDRCRCPLRQFISFFTAAQKLIPPPSSLFVSLPY